MTSDEREYDYPGKSLGRPRSGPGSVASVSRRVGAIATDWAAIVLLSVTFFDYAWWSMPLLLVVIHTVFIATAAGSPGHRIWGLRVVRRTGERNGLWRPLVRSALLALVIPAAIWDENQRGLHDLLADTVVVRG